MYLGIDVGFSRSVRTTGICVIEPANKFSVRFAHVRTDETIRAVADLLGNRRPLASSIDGPLRRVNGRQRFSISHRYRDCERALSGGIFQSRCKPGATNSPRGFALHKQSTRVANWLAQRFPQTLITESFPNAFLGVMLPDPVFDAPIPRGIKSDVFWLHCLRRGLLRRLVSRLFGPGPAGPIFTAAAATQDHDERAAFICAAAARGAESEANFVVEGKDGAIALPPVEFIQPWARRALKSKGLKGL